MRSERTQPTTYAIGVRAAAVTLWRRIATSLLLLVSLPAIAQYVTLTGTLQSSNGLPAANDTISFTPTQWFYVAGQAVVVNGTSDCATSADGSVVGTANPLTPATITAAYSGTLPAGNYFVEYTFYGSGWETLASPESRVQLTAAGAITIPPPSSGLPAATTGMRVYIGTSSGTETLQGSTTGSGVYAQSVPLTSGANLPATNTSQCKQIANDAGWPTGTGYTVSLTDPNGNTLPGYPMQWQLLGPNTTINLSNGLPYYHGVVTYPSPILATPQNHQPQSISGPVNLSNYALTGVSALGIGTNNPAFPVDVENGAINASGGYLVNGGAGSSGQCLVSNGSVFLPGTCTTGVNAGSYATFDQALAACPATGPCLITFPVGTWTTTHYNAAGCISRSNLTLIGAGRPTYNSVTDPTALVGGTIIEPGLDFCGASNVTVSGIGFDDGPNYSSASGIASDGLDLNGTSGGTNPSDPLVTGNTVSDVIALGSGDNAQYHGILVEHNDHATITNVSAANDTHCVVIKSTNVTATGVVGMGCHTDVLDIKADAYTSTANVTVSNIVARSINPGDTLDGIALDAEQSGVLSGISVSNVTTDGVQFPFQLLNNSSVGVGGINTVSISNVTANLTRMPAGQIPSCVVSSTTSANHGSQSLTINGFNCVNSTSYAVAPLEIYNDWYNSQISNWTSLDAGYMSTLGGDLNIVGWYDGGTSSSVATFTAQDGQTAAHVTGYVSVRGNAATSNLPAGASITISGQASSAIVESASGAGCTTGATSYSVCTSTVTWPTPFVDTNYQVSCTGIGPYDTSNPTSGRADVTGVISKTATGVVVQAATMGSNPIGYSSFDCIAVHQ